MEGVPADTMDFFSAQVKQQQLLEPIAGKQCRTLIKPQSVCACVFCVSAGVHPQQRLVVGHPLLVSRCVRVSWRVSARGHTGCLEVLRKGWTGACCAEVSSNIFLLRVNFYSLPSVVPQVLAKASSSLWQLPLQQQGGLNVSRLLIRIQTLFCCIMY